MASANRVRERVVLLPAGNGDFLGSE
jgi:hypothetical protein